ncbi:MAG: serine hydrolase, partial [Bacteroidia bacterium]|nr:serine hydrolase [Bacteroidia bacterium]
DYIPEFKLYDPFVTEDFRIRDLLTHRCGLGLGAGDLMFFPDSAVFSVNDAIYNLRFLKPESPFRTKFQYNNLMFITAGELIHRVSGKSWFDFIEERFFKPLGMTESHAQFNRIKDKSNMIEPHAICDKKLQVISHHNSELMSAAGTIFSNVTDLSKWLISVMNGMAIPNSEKTLVSKRFLNEMLNAQTPIQVNSPGAYNTHFSAYGLGFFLSDVKGYKQISHSGGLPGNVTQLTMLPEIGLGIIVLTNQQEGGAFRAITDAIKDAYLGIEGNNRVVELSTRRNKSVAYANRIVDSIYNLVQIQANLKIKRDFSRYIGRFTDAWMGEFKIQFEGAQLRIVSLKSPKMKGELKYLHENVLLIRWDDRTFDADALIRFNIDSELQITGFTLEAISPMTDFSFDFSDLNFVKMK